MFFRSPLGHSRAGFVFAVLDYGRSDTNSYIKRSGYGLHWNLGSVFLRMEDWYAPVGNSGLRIWRAVKFKLNGEQA